MMLEEFLERASDAGGLQTDDVLVAFVPLARLVAKWHEEGQVAPQLELQSLELDADGSLRLTHAAPARPLQNKSAVEALQRPAVTGLQVVGRASITSDDEAGFEYDRLDVLDWGQPLRHPAYFTGYRAWEQAVEHHDALVDIFSLGLLLATLALDLDFNDRGDLQRFVQHRDNLFALNGRLHPVIAAVIREMTQLDRHQRPADLASLIRRLECYREQPTDLEVAALPGFVNAATRDRRRIAQEHLRDRLFEISRRNRLIYFKPTQATVNLTIASVPLVVQLSSIRREHLFVWQGALATQLGSCEPVNLGKHLRFEDQPYLGGALDRIIAAARRDRAEFGFAQLRLVIAFLHWHNLKDSPEERIVSPLLWLPVELTRKKGVKDHYVLEPTSSAAEVNPALRHHLRQLFALELPESVDLTQTTMAAFHRQLQDQIHATESAVTLRLADEPQIELVHERARQRLAQFKRKALRTTAAARARAFDHSYDAERYRPLGLQLFREKVLPTPLPQRIAAGGTVPVHAPHMLAAAASRGGEVQTQTFSLREQHEGNKYLWDFDLCSITLGNFNYRKMTLVRDYGTLIANEMQGAAFDRVFSIEPRALECEPPDSLSFESAWPVVQGDATQRAAVALARTGRSFIIQGPPGTGKSQTITNLIADYLARDKRVLFVCEKRAAIDVVFHRLRQQGLDELCCLIHDSQTDKKAFVQNLKQTYENWIAQPDGAEQASRARAAVIKRIQQDADQLERFDAAMTAIPDYVGGPVHDLMRTMAMTRAAEPALTPQQAEMLPDYAVWRRHEDLARRLASTLEELTGARALASHPFRMLSAQLLAADRPLQSLQDLTERIEAAAEEIERALADTGLPAEHWDSVEEVQQLVSFANSLEEAAKRGQLALLDQDSDLSRSLQQTEADLHSRRETLRCASERTAHWVDKLEPSDVDAALAVARAKEHSLFRVFSSAWRQLKRTLQARYDFSRHAVRPALSQVLGDLAAEHEAKRRLEEGGSEALARFGVDADVLANAVRDWRRASEQPAVRQLIAVLTAGPEAAQLVRGLSALGPSLRDLLELLPRLLGDGGGGLPLVELPELMRDLRESADILPDLLPLLTELQEADEKFATALRSLQVAPDALAAAAARHSLERLYRTERWLPRFDGRVLEQCALRLAQHEKKWLDSNAAAIRASLRRTFRDNVQLSTTSASQLDAEQKQFKKVYAAGRRELEHEFGKSMRFKSIRDLADGDSGRVIRDLKPIWLMSPLSVSDTLPLETELFDAVIFDEASQIPVEEAVPALYRASQVIVVGDEMQLPPTNFFTARADESAQIEVEEDEERVTVLLDADSLLTQSAKNLPATLLAWHYRSRSELLIGFSNAAFYAGNLYTVPDRRLPAEEQAELRVRQPQDASVMLDAAGTRPISFHFLEASPYENRCNPGEAAYIAELIRALLERGTSHSIGVVAFSEAQQTQIEESIAALAAEDADFSALLEEAYVREEDDQFCGLFVKNLENVQGDERDIIILSICYGPDREGRMLMNFGPINQRGGERRLNVIFSRARHRMMVVSSIRHHAITNDYNDGAAALKSFLYYAELASLGDTKSARAVLEGLNPLTRRAAQLRAASDAVVQRIARVLRERGHVVDEGVGQSRFRCDLAVRNESGDQYRLGILVDTEDHYANRNVVERCVTRPEILRAFGWGVMTVLARDWYHEPALVVDRIERRLRGEIEAADSQPDPPAAVEPIPLPVSSSPAPADVRAGDMAPATVKRCEFVEGVSAKFWEVTQTAGVLAIRYGRIGSQGQSMTKSFESAERARRELDKLFAEKLRKGYREVTV
jgi:predicted DNA-binding WGR domain protein